jgi:integrase
VRPLEHHAALPYAKIAAFVAVLRQREAVAARALEFLILTGARAGEATGARWSEIDLKGRLWIIPPGRMKAGREHRVPLSAPALAILAALPREGEFVWPGSRSGRPLSNMAMLALLAGWAATN